MSQYNYVPAKDHLVQLMIDHVAGEYDYPPTPSADHRRAAADLARQARDRYRAARIALRACRRPGVWRRRRG
jgi:hypothetical protein